MNFFDWLASQTSGDYETAQEGQRRHRLDTRMHRARADAYPEALRDTPGFLNPDDNPILRWGGMITDPFTGPFGFRVNPEPGGIDLPSFRPQSSQQTSRGGQQRTVRDLGLNQTGPGTWEFDNPGPMAPSLQFAPPDLTSGPPTSPRMDVPTIAPPPERVADPALEQRQEYLQGREGRVGNLFADQISEMKNDDPRNQPWWQRLGAVLGRIAAQDSISQAGVATEGYFMDEQQRREAIREAMLRYGLTQEDLRGATAEAGFAVTSGQHEATQGTLRDRYETDVANADRQFQVSEGRADRADARNSDTWRLGAQLAMDEYQRNQARLDAATGALASMGGQGGMAAAESLFGILPEGMQGQASQVLRRQALASMIEQEIASAGNDAGRARRSVHRRMEAIAGTTLPRPPNSMRDPRALAQFYVRNGVSPNSPAIADSFPGFGSPAPE